MAIKAVTGPAGVAGTTGTWTADQRFNNDVLLTFGTTNGTDWDFSHDGSDMYLQSNTGGLMIGLAASAPDPDNSFLHIWAGSAGSYTANGGSQVVIEAPGEAHLEIMTPSANEGQVRFSGTTGTDLGILRYFHAADTPASTFGFFINSGNVALLSASALAFQQATTISTTATTLTLDPTTSLLVGSDGSGHDVIFYSTTAGDNLTWDASDKSLIITGHANTAALKIPEGQVEIGTDTTTDGSITLHINDDHGLAGVATSVTGLKIRKESHTTAGSYTRALTGLISNPRVGGSNNQAWTTDPLGLVGVQAYPETLSSSTGAITGSAAFYASAAVEGGATFTNLYGLYVADQTLGTNDYAIYTNAGMVHFSDTFDFESTGSIGNGRPVNANEATLIVDRNYTTATSGYSQLRLGGEVTVTDGNGWQSALNNSGYTVTINSGNPHGNVSTLELYGPPITLTSGSVTNASTVYIGSAASGASNNYALYVAAGDSKFIGGNIIIGTNAKGIDFTANTADEGGAGSVSSELLDDYEEGTWVPVLTAATNNDHTYTSQDGQYTKVGRLVTLQGTVQINAANSSSGNMTLTGLPFTSQNTAQYDSTIVVGNADSLAITAGHSINGWIPHNSAFAYIMLWDVVTGTSLIQFSELTAGALLTFSATYVTAT